MKPATYGPLYAACMYTDLAEIARAHGYALAVHGSLARDFDLICIPWVPEPSTHEQVLEAMCKHFSILQAGKSTLKQHGRMAYTLAVMFGECAIDLSFMPCSPTNQ